MIAATRIHVAERGADARRMYLMAFGGAGPVHADAIARALRMHGYIVPGERRRHVCSRVPDGANVVRAREERGRPAVTQERLGELDAVYVEMEDEGRRLLAGAGLPDHEMTFVRQADLRHAGQGHEIVLELPFAELERADVEREIASTLLRRLRKRLRARAPAPRTRDRHLPPDGGRAAADDFHPAEESTRADASSRSNRIARGIFRRARGLRRHLDVRPGPAHSGRRSRGRRSSKRRIRRR